MPQQRTEKSIFRAIFRIDFEIMTTMIVQIPFPDSTSFELKVLIPECVTLEIHGKKNLLNVAARKDKSIFRVIFRIDFGIMTTMILQNTISRFNLFRIGSFDS